MNDVITPKKFLEFCEREWGVEFINKETGNKAVDEISDRLNEKYDWKTEFDRRQQEMDEIFAELERNGEI